MTIRTQAVPVAIRDVAAADEAPARRIVEGIVVPYNVVYGNARDVGPGAERFAPGAFAASVAAWASRSDGARVPILDRHDGAVIGTADLEDTPEGLRFRGELLDVPEAGPFATRVRAGVNGISAEFDPVRKRPMLIPRGVEHVAANLIAIAGSHAPAYDSARASMRSRPATGGERTMPTSTNPPGYIETISTRLDAQRERRDALTTVARVEERELDDSELAELDAIDAAIKRLEPTLARAREERSRRASESTAAAAAAPTGERSAHASTTERSAVYAGPGEFLRDMAGRRNGDRAAESRLERFYAERALADETTTNMAGLVPKAIIGGVIAGMHTRRPFVESTTHVPIGSSGMTMVRPLLTGGDVDLQAVEKTQVTSTAMTATTDETPLLTYAGGVDVSWQLIERSSPSALDALFRRLANRYARRTEIVATAKFLADLAAGAGLPAAIVTTAGLTLAKANTAVIAGAAGVAATDDVDAFPDTIWLSLTSWAALSGLLDNNGNLAFKGSSFGFGLGEQVVLKPVVVPRWAGANVVIGCSEFVESYELPGSPVEFRSIEAALLGTNISVAGLYALNVTNPLAFQRITLTA